MTETFTYERQHVRTPEILLHTVEEVVKSGGKIASVNDFDDTISRHGPTMGKDPRESIVDPQAASALKKIVEAGHYAGIISNRSGGQVAKRLHDAGLTNALIIGTYGWELFRENDTGGTAKVDEAFTRYSYPISSVLNNIRTNLLKELWQRDPEDEEVEQEIMTPGGPIILERKALSIDFPEGLAHVYNFNIVDSKKAAEIVRFMQQLYAKQINGLEEVGSLKQFFNKQWGMNYYVHNPAIPEQFSLEFGPLIHEGKAYGMRKLLNRIKQDSSSHLGLIIFAGDSNADADAMKEARREELESGGKIKSAGIWVRRSESELFVKQQADFAVKDVKQYAQLLERIADIIQQPKQEQSKTYKSLTI